MSSRHKQKSLGGGMSYFIGQALALFIPSFRLASAFFLPEQLWILVRKKTSAA